MPRLFDARFGAFLEKARSAPNLDELDSSFGELISEWGFRNFHVAPLGREDGETAFARRAVRFGQPVQGWGAHYMGCAYWRHDSLVGELHRGDEGIWWSDHAKRDLSSIEKHMFGDARSMGIGEGLSIPVRLADGELWVCQLTTDELEPRWDVAEGAFLAANRYLYRALKLARDTDVMLEGDPLTRQQWKIIGFLEQDLPLTDVAKAMKLKPSTVYNHVAGAKERLNVNTLPALLHAARKLRPGS